MPGLFGATYLDESPEQHAEFISAGLARMIYSPEYVFDPVFIDSFIGAGRVHTGILGERSSPAVSGDVRVWVEGEAYNTSELAAAFAPGEASFAGVLAQAQRAGALDDVLAMADGSFTAVVYDAKQKVVRLAGDRHGTRPLYVLDTDDRFAWASELKAFLVLDGFNREVLREAVECFMAVGHFVGDLTWFGGVTLIPAATVITRDLRTKETRQHRYWSWGQIGDSHIGLPEAADALGEMIGQAVAARWEPGVGIGLSGGLDSRTLLAGTPDPAQTPCYTFGRSGCWDIVIARQAAAVRKTPHTVFELLPESWYDNREDDVLRTDGMQNLLHMHASPVLPEIAKLVNINLNGFFGDVIGGYFLQRAGDDYSGRRADAALAQRLWGEYGRYDDPSDPFYDIASPDPYVANSRMRRFSITGSINHGAYIEQRYPFLDNRIVEFVYSLPEGYRRGGQLYHAMLLGRWPELFGNIPWQSTGIPIGRNSSGTDRLFHKLRHLGHRLRLFEHPQAYADYRRWIQLPVFAEHFRTMLDPENAVYPDYTGSDFSRVYLEPHLEGKADHSDMICRALTLERWLRYVNNVPMPDTLIMPMKFCPL